MVLVSVGSFLAPLLEVTFLQELLVLVTFAFSFTLWRRLKPQKEALKGVFSCGVPQPKDGFPAPQKVVKTQEDFSREEQEHAKTTEKEMQNLFANGEFTRALNVYRRCERNGWEVLFTEELFTSLVQSGIRVSKLDVVERTLRTMKRIKMKPSLEFWQLTLKMLSSRKHFALCLVAYSIFECQIPVDKVIYSCLINAGLESKQLKRIPDLLKKFSQASLKAKDHILHFRCYVQLGACAHEALQLFRSLAPEVTNLMLNLALHACVNQREEEAAYALLSEAKGMEERHLVKEKIVDIVSYNTVLKGFSAAKRSDRCFDLLKDLMNHGLEPNEISLAALMEAGQNRVASEIGEVLLRSVSMGSKLTPGLYKAFLRGLVRANQISQALALYEAMKEQKVALTDIAVFSVLIKALVDQRDSRKAFELVEDLKAEGLPLDDLLLTHVLEACRHECNYQLGKKFYQDALDSGVAPSEVTLVTLLKLFGRCGASEEAFQTLKTWESLHKRRPSVIHYTCLMQGCFRSKNYELAWASYQLMLENGIQPDDTTISTLISGMVQGHQWDKVLPLAPLASLATLRLAAQKAPEQEMGQLKALMKKASHKGA